MNLTQFRSDKARVRAAYELLNRNPVLREMLEALDESSPLRVAPAVRNWTTAEHQDSRLLGYVQGWHAAIDAFRALGTIYQEPTEPPQTYPDK